MSTSSCPPTGTLRRTAALVATVALASGTLAVVAPAATAAPAPTAVQAAALAVTAGDVDAGQIGVTAINYGPKVPVTLTATGGREPYTFAVATKTAGVTVTLDGAKAALSTTQRGAGSFTYTATDADGVVSAPATVSFEGVNNPPLVRDLHYTIGKGKALDLWPYTRDDRYRFYFWQDYNDKQRMTYGTPGHGTLSPFLTEADVTREGWGTFPTLIDFPKLGYKQTYTPDPGFVGTDSFTYTATDVDGASSTATITVDVVAEKAVRGVLNGVRYKCQPQGRDENDVELPEFTEFQVYVMGGSMAFTVDTRAELPRYVAPGEVFTPPATAIDLVMPQGLGEILAGNDTLDTMGFGQTAVGGYSIASVHLKETATGKEYDAPLNGLKADDVAVSWPVPSEGVRIPATGALDALTAPSKGAIEVSAPTTMSIVSKLTPGIMGGAITDVWLECAAMPGQDLLVGTVYVKGPSTTKATVAPVKYGAAPVVNVTVASANAPQGRVEVREGSKVVGRATVKNGKARVTLPRATRAGKHGLKVSYLGFDGAKSSSASASYTVAKASSKVRAKVVTKKVRAKKTKAKVRVLVAAPNGLARGTVTLRVKGKVVGKAKVGANGNATVKLKKFAKRGKVRITVSYAGNGNVKASTTTVKLKVRR